MKKLLLYSFAAILFIASCTKSDNPKLPNLAQVPPPLLLVDTTANTAIPTTSLAATDAFSGKFTVGLYYPTGPKPQKYDVVIEKNGDPTKVETVLASVTTFPVTVTLTGLQIRTLFGVNIAPGDVYTLGTNITTIDGKFYPAFPVSGAAAFPAADFAAPGFSPNVSYSALCAFVPADYGAVGVATPYIVVRDDWADYAPGTTIPVTVVDATHIEFYYATDVNPKPIIIRINPLTNLTTATKQAFGSYSSLPSYGTFSAASENSAYSYVLPCALTIGVTLHITSPAGDFGPNTIILQKK
jgi:hypothetical protein